MDSAAADGAVEPFENGPENAAVLKSFKFKEMLGENSTHKDAFVLFDVNDSQQQAILLVERTPFPVEEREWNTIVSECSLKNIMNNDIYSSYVLFPPQKYTGIKTTLINPCSEKHIVKYRAQKRYIVHETADDYKSVTLPYLQDHQLPLQWVFNVLDHKAEVDRIIIEDSDPLNGFMLLPDLKWDGKLLTNLYVQAIVRRKGIKSIRDLTANDLPLLENIRAKSYKAIKEKYGIDEHQIRAYFHYHPSFYHLHVHFIHVSYEAPASGVGKAYLLEDVINNIKMIPDYYQRSTLSVVLKESDPLLKIYRELQKWNNISFLLVMLLFCPECGSSLQIEEGSNCYQFNCHNCPYVQPITKLIKSRHYPKLKDLDEVLGGPGVWENAQITNERCPRCGGDRAYFMQLQTRSADEPMTVFYRCANSECAHRWKE